MQAALSWINENLSQPIGNPDLAERCGMSQDHFIRTFAKFIGQTPAQYVIERRIAAASERLLFSDDSIEQIATATGFANRFHFSRTFARQMNTSPAAYRKARV